MSKVILRQGVATPYVLFNFRAGSIESKIDDPRYFMSLEHTRTCREACTFKLTIVYVPDTFSPGNPTLIDNLILSSVREKISYRYGYCDSYGNIYMQECSYSGQLYTYNTDINIDSGVLTYTVEGTAAVADLSNSIASLPGGVRWQPSVYLKDQLSKASEGGLFDLKQYYALDIDDRQDEIVDIPEFGNAPVLDLLMGTVQTGAISDKGLPTRKGGLVQLSHCKRARSMEEGYALGLVSQEDYEKWSNKKLSQARSSNSASAQSLQNDIKELESQLVTPYICYIDDIESDGKCGTFHYVKRDGQETDDVFMYEFGNDCKDSNVLSFSVSYDGSKAVAAAPASNNISNSISAEGSNQGSSNTVCFTGNLGRNTYPTLSGFDEDYFISKQKLSDIMLYPYEADMTIVGELKPHQLLDTIYVVVKLNGTEHPTLTGTYQILDISDHVGSDGFTTTFHLIREVDSHMAVEHTLENYVTNAEGGSAHQTMQAWNATTALTTNNTTQIINSK